MSADYYLIVPASGIGSRMQTSVAKQYLMLDNGLSVLDQTLKTLLNIEQIKGCVIALAKDDDLFKKSQFYHHQKILKIATGGKQRHNSVINALIELKPFVKNTDWILVHDAARPCVEISDIEKLINQVKSADIGGLLAIKVIDTIKQANKNLTNITIDRSNLWQAQTPQMYRFGELLNALTKADTDNINITDEASAIEYIGLKSLLVESSKRNFKITNPEDLALANFYLKS
jgi:2-C-methyl-D-erythritol 4-phosphate cytidylyltransferase